MKNNDIDNKTTEKLEGQLKGIKIITGALIGVLTMLLIVSVYGLVTKENNATFIALIAVAISCSGILPSQFINMKKIKTELNSRKENN
ncbi:hypothetical protein [uncultured Winogradskyella sp.]|uniref:hypothetical protein n=1 Tax=uncultured Winogradskyella sp. TaxID=395353 RepID=UPI0026327D9A|nr:hypothetical protein [uncultured Winogradskyella sp.]